MVRWHGDFTKFFTMLLKTQLKVFSTYRIHSQNLAILIEKEGDTMIKGVNRKVIEVRRPDSLYFERAVLYLRPEVSESGMLAASAEGEAFLSAMPGSMGRSGKNLGAFLLGMLSAGILIGGAVAAWRICSILQ